VVLPRPPLAHGSKTRNKPWDNDHGSIRSSYGESISKGSPMTPRYTTYVAKLTFANTITGLFTRYPMRYLTLIPGTDLLNPLRVTLQTCQQVYHPVSHSGRSSLTPKFKRGGCYLRSGKFNLGLALTKACAQYHKSSSRTAFRLGYRSKTRMEEVETFDIVRHHCRTAAKLTRLGVDVSGPIS
jgi:hypothetical protein